MKKVSKRVQSTKLNEDKYFSLNGDMSKKIKGGVDNSISSASSDRVCEGGCSATAAF